MITKGDLQKFCAEANGIRPSIEQPFSQGAFSYATDGKIMVRIPRLADVPENEKAPQNVGKHIFDDIPSTGPFDDLPQLPPPLSQIDCPKCYGHGKSYHRDCHDCQGHTCASCYGNGKIDNGPTQTVMIGKQMVAVKLLRRIAELPDVKIANAEQPMYALSFTFADGEGRIMPMRDN